MAKQSSAAFNPQQAIGEALALHRQGRLDEAEKLYSRVLKAKRDHFDALHLLGMLNHQRGKAVEAFRLLSAALKADPRSADALSNLGLVLHALKRDTEALASLDRALSLAPDHLDAPKNRATILLDMKRAPEAVAGFDAVLARAPRHLQALVNRGSARAAAGAPDAALADYDAALALAPGHPHAHYNRGNALRDLGRDADAIADYDRALAAMPAHTGAWHNRALALAALNRHDEALQSYARVLERQPDHADAHFNAAASLLTLGDFARGFAEYEWRWKRAGMGARRSFRQPLWLGAVPLAHKTILLHAEQGLGDTVQFARYAPLLAQSGASVLLEVQPELKGLLASLDGVTGVYGRGEPLPAFDLQCPLASLPLALKIEAGSIASAGSGPYLRAPDAAIARWRARLDALPQPRIALAWAGSAGHANDRRRSVPPALLEPLFGAPGVSFVSVQRDLRPGDADLLTRHPGVMHVGGELSDFADTAAVLALCDRVITVDTAVAHVAGALGRPAFVLLPFQPDWRWLLGRDDSPWYASVRLFRQAQPGDWAGVVDRLSADLSNRARG